MTIEKFNIFDLQLPSSFWSIYHDKCLRVLMFIFIKILTVMKDIVIMFNTNSTIFQQRAKKTCFK